MIERLEPRRLLTVIALVGTSSADKVTITQSGDSVVVKNRGVTKFVINGDLGVNPGKSRTFTGLTGITADLGGGNDRFIAADGVSVPVSVSGGSRNDTIVGGSGDDELVGGRDNDSVDGAAGNDTISGDGGDRSGADTLFGGPGADSLDGGRLGDALYGDDNDADASDDGPDTLRGADGNDYLDGNGAADSMAGGDGDDFFSNIDDAIDTIDGGAGFDRAEPAATDGDLVSNVEQNQSLIGAQNISGFFGVFNGTAGDDVITLAQDGERLDFTINGLSVSTTLQELRDIAEIQIGIEQLFGLNIRAGGGNDVVTLLTPLSLSVEVYGDAGDDTLIGTTAAERLAGGAGNDLLDAGAGNDRLIGGSDDDTLMGGAGNDTLEADGFDDRTGSAIGPIGADVLSGGEGNDTATYESRSNNLVLRLDGLANDGEAGEGDNLSSDLEIIAAGDGNDLVVGDANAQTINGGGGSDTLVGGGGNDSLAGDLAGASFGGDDSLSGGDGNDTLDGGADEFDADTLAGGNGTDTADYSGRTRRVFLSIDGVANDGFPDFSGEDDNIGLDVENLLGGSANDSLTGSAGGNSLVGNAGNDTLSGLGGNDTLAGGAGNDSMSGGSGNDRFLNRDRAADTLNGGTGLDTADNELTDVRSLIETLV